MHHKLLFALVSLLFKSKEVVQHVIQGADVVGGDLKQSKEIRNNFLHTEKNRTLLPMNQKNVLQGQHEADKIWSKEGFYAVVIFLSIFVIIVTCLMILYRLKERFQLSLRQDKEKNQEIHLSPITLQPALSEAKTVHSMVQPEQAPKVLNVVVDPQGRGAPEIKATTATSVCPSPFKMKPIGLQERRGSNVSLTLDMSSLGNIEPFVSIPTPREKVAMEYLQSASRILTRSQLRDVVASSHLLQSEFMEIPMNFVDPKEIDIPRHGTKNRYKTILPNPLSRVCLRPKNVTDSLSTYINANYIRGYSGKEKAFIATQGPMINTVDDFWQMVWQEDSPVIVMITKLKEKNEKRRLTGLAPAHTWHSTFPWAKLSGSRCPHPMTRACAGAITPPC
ncbi:receptor-type tyrosine-protein phosphatase R isoform X3 [Homo sapiens]|uniref:receptor-type tyrosine-protein phosphatase R isoform X3 n=1 Tax=Homo sapiens TaxID=9606 RepID=UPI001FB11162|nr:receptor-type tyrosine-protein phosphatase R isoform X3 [Homo sapiens]